MPGIYKESFRQVCAMAVPFRIPKKKQPSDSCSLNMQSPLSRLQDDNSQKTQWGSVTYNGRTPNKIRSNENMLSEDSHRRDSVRPIKSWSLTGDQSPDLLSSNPKGSTNRLFSLKLNKEAIKFSPARVNGTPNKLSDTSGFRPQCQTPSAGRDFTGNNRWRPKRASDTLLSNDENHTGEPESSAFKICKGLDLEDPEQEEEAEETQGCSQMEEKPHSVNLEDLKLTSTYSACDFSKKAASENNNGTVPKAKSVSTLSHPKHILHSGPHLQEASAKLQRPSGERAATSVPVRKDPLTSETTDSNSKDPFVSYFSNALKRKPRVLCKTYKRNKHSSSEPIVLSSDDEGADGTNDTCGGLQKQQISEGIRDSQTGNQSQKTNAGAERSTTKVEVPSIVELEFSRIHFDTIQAQANGTVVITDEGISVPLKGVDGEEEIAISISSSELHVYGVWDGGLARDGSLLSNTEEPAPSLLFLIVSDAQARLLRKELSVLHNAHTSGYACPFVLLVLSGQLEDLQTALLASLMDVIGLKYSHDSLCNTLSWADGLSRLHCHPKGEHLLSLLGQNIKDAEQDMPKENTSGTKSLLKEPAVRRPLRSHSKQQSLPRRLIQYPPPPSKGGITVTTEDLECLKDGEFLNDVIIDFYLKYLLLERADKDVAERSHIFSSFFYKQLTRKDTSGPKETGTTSAYRRHQRVRTWTRHVDIFSKDYLFIPVNHEAHWYLVLICFPALEKPQIVQWRHKSSVSQDESQTTKERSTGESQRESSPQPKGNRLRLHNIPGCTVHSCTKETVCRSPCILIMDSLKLSCHHHVYTLLREYLQEEWKVRKGSLRSFSTDSISGSLCRVPLQDNSSDCGLYLLQYVESFLQNPVVDFVLPLRLDQWFPRSQVRKKREELRELVLQLYRRQTELRTT